MFWECPCGNRAQECKRRPETIEKPRIQPSPSRTNFRITFRNEKWSMLKSSGFPVFPVFHCFSGPRLHDRDGVATVEKPKFPTQNEKLHCFHLRACPTVSYIWSFLACRTRGKIRHNPCVIRNVFFLAVSPLCFSWFSNAAFSRRRRFWIRDRQCISTVYCFRLFFNHGDLLYILNCFRGKSGTSLVFVAMVSF